MDGSKPEDIENKGFRELFKNLELDLPYEGEVREPINALDAAALDIINAYGDTNVPPMQDNPYLPGYGKPMRGSKEPNVVTQKHNQYIMGENFMKGEIDLDGAKLVVTYSKDRPAHHILPSVMIDCFKPEGGIASRTSFFVDSETEDIWKTHQTDFSSQDWLLDNPSDFSRPLDEEESYSLVALLRNPTSHNASEHSKKLTRVGEEDAKLTEENWARICKERAEHEAALKSVVDARNAPLPRDFVIG